VTKRPIRTEEKKKEADPCDDTAMILTMILAMILQ
jgi:hypothetical protein